MYLTCRPVAAIDDPPKTRPLCDAANARRAMAQANLKAVKKRQDPGQVHRDLTTLNRAGFTVVAMTIIGLP